MKPLTPASGVLRIESGSTTTSLQIEMPEITGTATGGSDITSYSLEWNSGSGTIFTSLVGTSSDNMNRIFN